MLGRMDRSCTHCRHYTYQCCYIGAVLTMSPHCANWYRHFPHASRCNYFEREPGSDDEIQACGLSVAERC